MQKHIEYKLVAKSLKLTHIFPKINELRPIIFTLDALPFYFASDNESKAVKMKAMNLIYYFIDIYFNYINLK